MIRKIIQRSALFAASAGLLGLPFLGIFRTIVLIVVVFTGFLLWTRAPFAWAGNVRHPLGAVVGMMHHGFVWRGAIVLLIVVPPFLSSYIQDVLVTLGLYIILSLGLNIHVGLAGMLNLGFIAFYAVGAYTHALLSTLLGFPFWVNIILGTGLAWIFGYLLCLPTLRLRGDYLAIVTLGFGEMMRIVLNNWDSLTGGPNGVLGVSRPRLPGLEFSSPIHFYYLVALIVSVMIGVTRRLINSRVGRAWMAIREDEVAAEAMGVNTSRMKILAFSIGAGYAGLAGSIFAAKQGFVSPESFTFLESVLVLCMVVLGGMGSLSGPILGAVILVILPEVLREFHLYRMLIFGAAMVAIMIYRPHGLWGQAPIQMNGKR